METQKLYRGRLIDHIQLVVRDLPASKKFYTALFEVLGISLGGEAEDHFWCDELFVSRLDSPASAGELTGRHHFAFAAKDKAMVEAGYEKALAAGGKDNGKPGEQTKYHPGYYAAFLLDPDGNNVELVFHGPAKRSAESIEITF